MPSAKRKYIESQEQKTVRKIGWIDNTIDKFGSFITSFENSDSIVFAARSVDEFLFLSAKIDIDHLFLDYDLLGSTGFHHIPRLLERGGIGNIYICTAYSYVNHVNTQVTEFAESRPEVGFGILPKEMLPYADEPEKVREFLKKLDDGRFRGDLASVKSSGIKADDAAEFPDFERYSELTIEDRIQLLKVGRRKFSEFIDAEFSGGYIWVFINSANGELVWHFKDSVDIPDGDELDEYCERNKIVPLVYARGWSLDSLDGGAPSSLDCVHPSSDVKNYATLGVDIPSVTGTEVVREFLHFDSGNCYSLFSYEYFLEKGCLKIIFNPVMREQGDLELWGKDVTFKNTTILDSRGNSAVGNVKGFAAIQWHKHRIALECLRECGQGSGSRATTGKKICNRRKALIGKNLGIDIQRDFLISGSSDRVTLIRET